MSYLSTAIKRARYLITRDSDHVLILEKNNGSFMDLVLDTVDSRDAAITAKLNDLLAGAPDALNTLNELAAAIGDDADFAATVTTALAARLQKSLNLSDLPSASTARTNLGLGSAALHSDTDFDTSTARDTAINAAITTAVNNLLAGVPTALNTLNKLAGALGDDASFSATVATALNNRALTASTPAQRVTHGLLTILRRGVESATILIAGDSTSTKSSTVGAPLRWPPRLASLLGAAWPGYTVVHSQWIDSPTFAWDVPLVLQAGPNGLRTDTVTGSSASNVIADAAIVSGDVGKRVIGANIPPRAKVGAVTSGVSFTLVREDGAQLLPLGAVTSIQLGADPVLAVWNAAVAGSRFLYGFGPYSHKMYGIVRPDLIIANHGHNETSVSTSNGKEVFRSDYLCGIEMLTEQCPGAGVILTGQNPRTDSRAADEPINTRLIAQIAGERGYGYVDIYQVFVDNPTWMTDWMFDSLHPNDAGYTQWAAELYRMFTIPAGQQLSPPSIPRSLFLQAPNEQLIPDGLLLDWPTSGLPSGWTTSNLTVTKDETTYPGVRALQLVGSAPGSFLSMPMDIAKVAGHWVTATIRTTYAAAADPYECSAVAIHYTDADGTPVKLTSTNPSLAQNGQHAGLGAWFYQSVSAYIPEGAIAAQVWLLGDQLGSAAPTWVRRVVVTRGRQPAGDVPISVPTPFVTGSVVDSFVSPVASIAPSKVSGLGSYLGTLLGADFKGIAGNYYTTPSAAANKITGTIELGAKLGVGTVTNGGTSETLIGKWSSAIASRAYKLYLSGARQLRFTWNDAGDLSHDAISTVATLPATLTSELYVRVQFDPTTGTATFATSADGITWTAFGAPVVFGATSIYDNDENVEVGSSYRGTLWNFTGVIESAWIATTFGGAHVVNWVLPSAGASSWVASSGETWTLHGTVPAAYGVSQSMMTPADSSSLSLVSARSSRALLAAPAGAVAVTYDRTSGGGISTLAAPVAGTCLVIMIPVEKSALASVINFRTGDTAGAGTTGNVHQWAAILDSTGKVVGVTTDKLLTAMTSSSKFSWAIVTPFTLNPNAVYYVCLMISMNTTQPQLRGINSSITSVEPPITCGPGSTGQTVPPNIGDTLLLPTAATSNEAFVWVT